MEDVKQKFCPFLVIREYRSEFRRVLGIPFVENFQLCKGKECAAYYRGGCLRLVPPALVIDGNNISDADIEKLREELKAPIMPAPVEPEGPHTTCSNCGYYENKAGCADCIYNAANRFRKETMPSNWVPKPGEVPW